MHARDGPHTSRHGDGSVSHNDIHEGPRMWADLPLERLMRWFEFCINNDLLQAARLGGKPPTSDCASSYEASGVRWFVREESSGRMYFIRKTFIRAKKKTARSYRCCTCYFTLPTWVRIRTQQICNLWFDLSAVKKAIKCIFLCQKSGTIMGWHFSNSIYILTFSRIFPGSLSKILLRLGGMERNPD